MTREKIDIDGLRHAVRAAVDESSLRAVADEVGMSWSGLRTFLAGRQPHRDTVAKLVSWRAGSKHRGPALSRADMLVTVEVLADYIEGPGAIEGKLRRLTASLELLSERLGSDTARALAPLLRSLKG